MNPCKLTYTGNTPGADSSDYTLYDSVVATPAAKSHINGGLFRFFASINNVAAGTIKIYRTSSRIANPSLTTSGVTWHQVYQASIAAVSGNIANTVDVLVEAFDDFKVVWTNGGSAQTTWDIDMALTPSRNPSV